MGARVLLCLEDGGVASVVAARLLKDGIDGVVVERPALLVDEARKGVAAVAIQDKYPSGEAGSSLLRQIRVARAGVAAPAVVLVTGDLGLADRHVLERQYKVKSFLPASTNPLTIGEAVRAAAMAGGGMPDEASEDLIVREDPGQSDFEISIESVADDKAFDDAFDEEEATEVNRRTPQMRRAEIRSAPADGTEEREGRAAGDEPEALGANPGETDALPTPGPTAPHETQEGETITVEGHLLPAASPGQRQDEDALAPTPSLTLPPPAAAPLRTKSPNPSMSPMLAPPPTVASGSQGEAVQIQELQRTQAELKKALIAERKAREVAQKRVDELEHRLAQEAGTPEGAGAGLPTEGVFEDIRYPALLARCRASGFTGSIVMQSGGATRTVFVRDGNPTAFTSSEPGERIGKVLVHQGRITDEQYMKAATRMVERSIKLTDALVELGLVDAEALAVEQRNLTRDQVIQGFELTQGRFTVVAGQTPDVGTPAFDFGPGEIYVQGYRRYAPAAEMLAVFETLRDRYLTTTVRLANFRPKLGLSSEDERLVRILGEALTIEEAVERTGVAVEAAARLLSALRALDLVEEWSPGVEQFRNRIRAERQKHAEEIAALQLEARRREQRLLDAFEKALARLGDSSGFLGATIAGGDAPRPATGLVEKTRSSSSLPSTTGVLSGTGSGLPRATTSSGATVSHVGATTGLVRTESATHLAAPPVASTAPVVSSPPTPPPAAQGTSSLPRTSSRLAETLSPADAKYREGIEHAAQNRLDEAEQTLREAVRLDATRPEFLTSLARVLLSNPRYERIGTLPVVRSLLDRAVQLAPENHEAIELRQQVLTEMGT